MTFNIQHGRNHNCKGDVIDLPLMAETVRRQNADIVGFNEVRCGTDSDHSSGYSDQAAFFSSALNGDCRFGKAINISENCAYGNAIFSKHPIVDFEVVMIPDTTERVAGYHYETRCVIKTDYIFGAKRLTVLNSHFGLGIGEPENAVDTVLSIASSVNNPVVLIGDFNLTPDNRNIKKLTAVFTDIHASLGRDEFTFPSDAPEMRIDYIFSRGLKIISAETVKVIASDHYSVTAELEL